MSPRISSSNVIDFVVHGVIGLVDIGLESVLELTSIQHFEERLDLTQPNYNTKILFLSLMGWPKKVVDSICVAASKWGFFQIVNQGVPLVAKPEFKLRGQNLYMIYVLSQKKKWVKYYNS